MKVNYNFQKLARERLKAEKKEEKKRAVAERGSRNEQPASSVEKEPEDNVRTS